MSIQLKVPTRDGMPAYVWRNTGKYQRLALWSGEKGNVQIIKTKREKYYYGICYHGSSYLWTEISGDRAMQMLEDSSKFREIYAENERESFPNVYDTVEPEPWR